MTSIDRAGRAILLLHQASLAVYASLLVTVIEEPKHGSPLLDVVQGLIRGIYRVVAPAAIPPGYSDAPGPRAYSSWLVLAVAAFLLLLLLGRFAPAAKALLYVAGALLAAGPMACRVGIFEDMYYTVPKWALIIEMVAVLGCAIVYVRMKQRTSRIWAFGVFLLHAVFWVWALLPDPRSENGYRIGALLVLALLLFAGPMWILYVDIGKSAKISGQSARLT